MTQLRNKNRGLATEKTRRTMRCTTFSGRSQNACWILPKWTRLKAIATSNQRITIWSSWPSEIWPRSNKPSRRTSTLWQIRTEMWLRTSNSGQQKGLILLRWRNYWMSTISKNHPRLQVDLKMALMYSSKDISKEKKFQDNEILVFTAMKRQLLQKSSCSSFSSNPKKKSRSAAE